jgi:DNA-directed RNA polymerase subunit K/omega
LFGRKGKMKKPSAVIFNSGKPKQQAIREIEKRLAVVKEMERQLGRSFEIEKENSSPGGGVVLN